MRFQLKQFRQMGNFLGKRDAHHCLEHGFGFGTWDEVHGQQILVMKVLSLLSFE